MLTSNDSRENNTKEIIHLKGERKMKKTKLQFYYLLTVGVCVGKGEGFMLLLEVLEKPWNLILDFKGA